MTRALDRRAFLRLTAVGSGLLGSRDRLAAAIAGAGPPPPLETARAAARWIRTSRITTAHGVTWPADPTLAASVGTTLYSHAPGVVLFLCEMVHATSDEEALSDAVAGADHLLHLVSAGDVLDPGLYTGLAGIAFTLEQVHRVSGLDRFREGAVTCVDLLIERARADRGGVGWAPDGSAADAMDESSSDIVSGAAGIGLTLLWAHERLGHPRALETAEAAGVRLAAVGESVADGLRWGPAPTFSREYPNFSHGTAGIAYFLARLGTVTGSEEFIGPARAGAVYLQRLQRCEPDGCTVFHHAPGGEDLTYLSWCHGPPGTARLFHQLALATGEDAWNWWVLAAARAVRAFGVPDVRSAGYWNNVSRCCGDAGVGEFFLALEVLTLDPAHGRYAQRLGDYIMDQSTGSPGDDDGLRWVQAENRTSPDDVVAQTGWMQGAAGVGAFFLHLDGRARRRRELVVLPDSPWDARF
jgi:hypothetical protein